MKWKPGLVEASAFSFVVVPSFKRRHTSEREGATLTEVVRLLRISKGGRRHCL